MCKANMLHMLHKMLNIYILHLIYKMHMILYTDKDNTLKDDSMEIVTTDNSIEVLKPDIFSAFLEHVDRVEKTQATYKGNLRQFAAYLSYKDIKQPGRGDIIAYRDYLLKPHDAIRLTESMRWEYRLDRKGNRMTVALKPYTVAQYLRTVSMFFKWTASSGIYPDITAGVHAPRIRGGIHRKDALTPGDVLKIEDTILSIVTDNLTAAEGSTKDKAGRISRTTEQGARLLALFQLAVNCGLRTIELERLNVRDVEVRNHNAVIFIQGKGHTEPDARKPIAWEVYETIQDYLQKRSDNPAGHDPLFVGTGNRNGGRRLKARTISVMLKKAMKAAGYDSERLTAHSLRHTAGTNVMQLSNNLFLTQHYMRHENPATTEIYLHCETESAEAELAEQLYKRYHTREAKQ